MRQSVPCSKSAGTLGRDGCCSTATARPASSLTWLTFLARSARCPAAGRGETTWAAGPQLKGSNLCHSTGGNGYAYLKLFKRTGDARWLQRARAFAMHGIRQTEAHAAQYGRLRYSLWTGDPGFVYLWDCIRGDADFPTLDVF